MCELGKLHLLVSDNEATIHYQSVPAIMYGARDQEILLITLVSSIQWVGQGHEQNFARVLEKTLDNGEREVGG